MLEKLEIKDFKSIKSATVEFGRVNLFIGGNGTGKSNLLEAIGLVSASLGETLEADGLRRRGIRVTPTELMKSSFKNMPLPNTFSFKATFKGGVTYKVMLRSSEKSPYLQVHSESARLSKQSKNEFGRGTNAIKVRGRPFHDDFPPFRGLWNFVRQTHKFPEELRDQLNQISRFAIYCPQTIILRNRTPGPDKFAPVGLSGEELPGAASSFLAYLREIRSLAREKPTKENLRRREILDGCSKLVWLPGWARKYGVAHASADLFSGDIEDRSGKQLYFVDKFMNERRNRLSAYDSSEGTLYLLFAAIVLSHPDATRIFAFDNVDNALNPLQTRRLMEKIVWVTQNRARSSKALGARQVFLTSHNPTSLDGIDLFDPDQKVFVIRRDESGHTVPVPLVPPEGVNRDEWQLDLGGKSLSELWVRGGIPNALGDIE